MASTVLVIVLSVLTVRSGKDRVSPTFVSFSYSKSKGPYMSSYVPGTIDVGAEMKAGNWEYS